MSYTREGNEGVIDSPGNYFGLVNCYPKPPSILAEEETQVEAAVIEKWGSKLSSQLVELQQQKPPNEIFLSSTVPPEISVTGSLEIFQDP